MTNDNLEQRRQEARQLCERHGVAVLPYGNGAWLIGEGISRVVGELAGLTQSDLAPVQVAER